MIKKRLSVLIIFVMLLTNFTFLSSSVSYADSPQKDKYELASDVLAELFEINKLLSEVGLDLESLSDLPDRDQQYYDAMISRMVETTSDTQLKIFFIYSLSSPKYYPPDRNNRIPLPKPSKESMLSADQWVYAMQMAIQNKKRDPEVKDISKETIYMYMSHYIDIPTGIIEEGIDKSISNDQYFSAWITREDRPVYDRYINDMKISDIVYGIASTITNLIDAVFSIEDLYEFSIALAETRTNCLDWIQVLKTDYGEIGSDFADDYKLFKRIIEAEENPSIAADNIKKSLTEKYGERSAEAIRAFLGDLTVLSGKKILKYVKNFKSIAPSFGINLAKVVNNSVKDFYNKIRWRVLIFSLSYRITARMNKYLGLYY